MITKIYAFNAERNIHLSARYNFKPGHPAVNFQAAASLINFKGENENSAPDITKETNETAKPFVAETKNMPYDVAAVYFSAQDMLQNLSYISKDITQTNLRAQETANEVKIKAGIACSSYKGKIPEKIVCKNNNGSEDVMFFTNGILNAYRKNERRTKEKTTVDKILTFDDGKLSSYKEGITISNGNNGSARQDVKILKSLEYNGIGTIYKEGYKSTAGNAPETKRIVWLILGKPWYFEEETSEKYKEKPGIAKRRLEFSNNERTTYSYQEYVRTFDDVKMVKRGLYVEENIPYRYCEDESFVQSSYQKFNSYENKRCFCLVNGKWQLQTHS